MKRALGKRTAVHHDDAILLAEYLPQTLLPVPPAVNNFAAVSDWGMMRNDELGDCTCAAAGHMIQAWTKLSCDKEIVIPDDEIVKAYSAVGGYNPDDPSTDQGAVEMDVLDYWRKTGIAGHKIEAHAVIETSDEYQVKLGIYLFGAVYAGAELPLSAQTQKVWTVVPGHKSKKGSWGGHAFPLLGYDAHRSACISWGGPIPMTWSWWKKYADEAHAALSWDWVDHASQMAPNHLDWGRLSDDLAKRFKK